MSRHETVGERILRSSLAKHAADLARLREEDPEAYQATIDAARARNPKGGRK